MRILIATNLREGKGLARDFQVLEARLSRWDHTVIGWQFDSAKPPPRADLVICLEVTPSMALEAAPRRWLIPNPEWWDAERDTLLSAFELVACKTRDALRLFSPRTRRTAYLGFTTADRMDAAVPRERRVLHNPGGSVVRGTEAVLGAWRTDPPSLPLTVVASIPIRNAPPGVEMAGRLDDSTHRRLQNACRFHLCPSSYEGFGHTLHEAASVGAVLITTAAPPMDEALEPPVRVPVALRGELRIARTAEVDAEGVREAMRVCAEMSDAEATRLSAAARERWTAAERAFESRLSCFLS